MMFPSTIWKFDRREFSKKHSVVKIKAYKFYDMIPLKFSTKYKFSSSLLEIIKPLTHAKMFIPFRVIHKEKFHNYNMNSHEQCFHDLVTNIS